MATVSKRRKHPPAYLRETEKINRNKEKYGEKVHTFKAAQWTHPNGHPRCLLCGQEESISPECNREPTAEDHKRFQEKLDREFPNRRALVAKHGHKDDPLYRVLYHPHGLGYNGNQGSESTSGLHRLPGRQTQRRGSVTSSRERRRAEVEARHAQQEEVARENTRLHGVRDTTVRTEVPSRNRRIIRNRRKVEVGEVERANLPSNAPLDRRNEARDYIDAHYSDKEQKYGHLVLRLASKGVSQDPTKRREMSTKYGVDVGKMIEVERAVYELLWPSNQKKSSRHPSVRLEDMPKVQRDAMIGMGARRAYPYPLDDVENGTPDRLFKATRGDDAGKWFRVTPNGIPSEVPAKQAEKDIASSEKFWKEQGEKMKEFRYTHERIESRPGHFTYSPRAKRISIKEWEQERARMEENAEDRAASAAAEKARKIELARIWAESLGLDPDDSYWWGVYWSDNSLVRSHEQSDPGVDPNARQPVSPNQPTARARRKGKYLDLPAADVDQRQMRGYKPGPKRDVDEDGPKAKAPRKVRATPTRTRRFREDTGIIGASKKKRKIKKVDPLAYICKMPQGIPGHVYRYKHGWIPLSHVEGPEVRHRMVTSSRPRRSAGSGSGRAIFDNRRGQLSDYGMSIIPRPPRGAPDHYHGMVPDKDLIPRATALYQRNNGSTKITNSRLKELWEGTLGINNSKPTKQELKLLSARSAMVIDGSDPIKTKTKTGGPKTFRRYDLIGQLAGKLTPGSGNRAARPTLDRLPETRQQSIKDKRVRTEKASAPQMNQWRQQILDDWGDGKKVRCMFCGKMIYGRANVSVEKADPRGTYTERANRWPAHVHCNERAGHKMGVDPQTYVEDNMRRFQRLPLATRKRLSFVHARFRRYLGPTPK